MAYECFGQVKLQGIQSTSLMSAAPLILRQTVDMETCEAGHVDFVVYGHCNTEKKYTLQRSV